jgi:hypothetical protein
MGVGFLLLSVLLLGIIGIAAVWGQLVGVAARDVKNELAGRKQQEYPTHFQHSEEAA